MPISPYEQTGFYDTAIAAGRHRAIVGGRWDETGRAAMAALIEAGLAPHHHLLDIGAGALRLGCKAVPFLQQGNYWATDASLALMRAGYEAELDDPARLDPAQLIEDADFAFPGVPDSITHAIAFAVFPHLPRGKLDLALTRLHRFTQLEKFLFTVFLAPDAETAAGPYRQADGVVTHGQRAPYHLLSGDIEDMAQTSGWHLSRSTQMLPRGQILFIAEPSR